MPIVFIHGVNVRDTDEGYARDVATRGALLRRLVVGPLAEARRLPSTTVEVVNPYWGGHGITFRWDYATLPSPGDFETFGTAGTTPRADLEAEALLTQLGAGGAGEGGAGLESMGAEDDPVLSAARRDPVLLVEAALAPLLTGEAGLGQGAREVTEEAGEREAALLIAADEAARTDEVRARLSTARTGQAALDVLLEATLESYRKMAAPVPAASGELEPYGLGEDLGHFRERVRELFRRVSRAPGRAAWLTLARAARAPAHREITRFLGDVFVYLNDRGTRGEPGDIVATVLGALMGAPRQTDGEPLVVLTHSMGGNILYDVLTHYAPDLRVDAWVSFGGQVGAFEEMKLFRESEDAVRAPHKVEGLVDPGGTAGVGSWLNVYDPGDVLAFRAGPVFEGVRDVAFSTGLGGPGSHGDYARRPRFHRLIQEHLAGVLPQL